MELIHDLLKSIYSHLVWLCLGALVGGIIGAITIYIGVWAMMLVSAIVALGLHLSDVYEEAV